MRLGALAIIGIVVLGLPAWPAAGQLGSTSEKTR
jgi:hypothetical protein